MTFPPSEKVFRGPTNIDAERQESGLLGIRVYGARSLLSSYQHLNALPEPGSDGAMTTQAESTDIGEVALAATLDDRDDVVGVPKRFARTSAKPPMQEQGRAARSPREAELSGRGVGVDSAIGADSAVTFKGFFA